MKTLQEIKNEVALECGYNGISELTGESIGTPWHHLLTSEIKDDVELIDHYMNIISTIYAEQAFDLAAETVEIKYVPYNTKLYDHPDWDLDNDGRFYQIDKESILSLKDQLK